MEEGKGAVEGLVAEPGFWAGKRVFLTGHTGFKGGWLSLWLRALGAQTVGFALSPPTSPNLYEAAKVGDSLLSLQGDVRDAQAVLDAIAEHRPEIVFHLAAQPLVRLGYDNPVETFATNVMGTVHVLDAVRRVGGTKVVIAVTSDKCYENREWLWGYREDEPMGGADPYSSSKGCAELVTAAYRRSFFDADHADHGVAVSSARAGNVIGGGDWAENRLIPDAIRAFGADRRVRLRCPDALRPWQHVLDPVGGYLRLAERMWRFGAHYAQAWNFGPDGGDCKSVSWIVGRAAELWGGRAGWEVDSGNFPHEAQRLRLDCSKARARLNWTSILTVEESVDMAVAWYRAHARGEDMHRYTMNEISDYMTRTATASGGRGREQ